MAGTNAAGPCPMSDLPIFYSVLLLLALVIAYQSIVIAAENERIVLFLMGRFQAIKGPGLVFKTNLHTVVRLAVGDIGVVTSAEFVRFGEVDIPLASARSFRVGDAVRIESFSDVEPVLSRSDFRPEQTCPKCGHKY